MSDNAMTKHSRTDWDHLAQMDDAEIDQSDMPALTHAFFERARSYGPHQAGARLVLLAPDVAQAFPSAEAVNEALRLAIRMGNLQRRAAS